MLQVKHLSSIKDSSAMRAVQSALVMVGMSTLMWAASLQVAIAEAGPMKLTVSATVLKHASLKVLTQPSSVIVTAADIAKGYVDVPIPASVQVKCNTADGFLLMFESQGEFMRQTVVKGLTNDAQISPAGGGIAHNTGGNGMRQAQLDLGFRFVLADSARQGVYPWPMRLSVVPL